MSPRILVGLILTVGGIALWTFSRHAHNHSEVHDHAQSDATALALDNGKRWETDQPLRTGMERIRDAASPVLAAHARGSVTPDEAKGLSASIQENVNYLMQNCKLEPKADAALHVLITDLLMGAGLLVENPQSKEGATLIVDALRHYPEYFNDPGWTPLPATQS